MKFAYLKHPVSAEQMADFRGRGFRIRDVIFMPEEIGEDDVTEPKPAKRGRPKLAPVEQPVEEPELVEQTEDAE